METEIRATLVAHAIAIRALVAHLAPSAAERQHVLDMALAAFDAANVGDHPNAETIRREISDLFDLRR